MKKKLLFASVAMLVVVAAKSNDPCHVYLDRAKADVEYARRSTWIGVDGARLAAISEVTDYLVCESEK